MGGPPRYSVFNWDIKLGTPDARTPEARLLVQKRDELVQHLGGSVTPLQRILVERAAMLQLLIGMYDGKILSGSYTNHDSAVYLAHVNSLRRVVWTLGLKKPLSPPDPIRAPEPEPAPPLSLQDRLRAERASRSVGTMPAVVNGGGRVRTR
jgi:hypothetical protein